MRAADLSQKKSRGAGAAPPPPPRAVLRVKPYRLALIQDLAFGMLRKQVCNWSPGLAKDNTQLIS